MKRVTLITLAITAIFLASVSCRMVNINPDKPIIPQVERNCR